MNNKTEKAIITIKGWSDHTRKLVKIQRTVNVPIFQDTTVKLKEYSLYSSRESKLSEWFDRNYFELVWNYANLKGIYSITESDIEYKSEKENRTTTRALIREVSILNTIDTMVSDEQMKLDMVHIYKELQPTIKRFSIKRQFDLIIKTTSISYKAAINTLEQLKQVGVDNQKYLEELKKVTPNGYWMLVMKALTREDYKNKNLKVWERLIG